MAIISRYYVDGKKISKYNNCIISNITIDNTDYKFANKHNLVGISSVVCDNSVNEPIYDMQIYGNSVQYGEPTPETPIKIESVGEYDEATGKYKIPVNISGKNLLNYGSAYAVSDKNYNGNFSTINISLPSGTRITTSADVDATLASSSQNAVSVALVYEDGTSYRVQYYSGNCVQVAGGRKGRSHASYVATKNVKQVILTIHTFNGSSGGTTIFSNFQIAIGSDFEYEPYIEPTTTNIYINTPLRKVGEYIDYLDYKQKKVVRSVEVLDESGTQNIESSYRGLATPIEELINIPEISTFKGTTVYSIESNVKPTSTSIEYWRQMGV